MLKAVLVGACALVIVACGSSGGTTSDDRQFANEAATRAPRVEETVTPTAVLDVDATPAIREPSPVASPEALLLSRGAPDTLYIEAASRLFSLSIRDGASVSTPIDFPAGYRLLDFDPSPTGDRVAVLLADGQGDVSLGFFTRDGVIVEGLIDVLGGDSATPVPDASGQAGFFVDWSPRGTDVLVSDGSVLESISVGGEVTRIPLDDFEGRLLAAQSSPQGGRIVLHFEDAEGAQRTYVHDVVADKTRELRPLSTTVEQGISNLQWLPNGAGVVYVRGSLDRGVVMHGQIYVYRLGQERAELVATPGQGGPSATITDVAISPDGRSVAYVISLLDGSQWSFHSLWVRALDGSQSYQVPVVPRGVVGHVAWVNGGLSWEQRRESNAPGQVLVIGDDGLPRVMFNEATAPVSATPVASPVASPGATPVATPGATPVGTPSAG